MQEPIGTTSTPISLPLTLLFLSFTVLLAYLVVVMTRLPRTREEWVVSLITTVIGSIAGGAFIVQYYGLHHYADNWFGLCAIGGIIFLAGLPFWAITRWTFNYVNKNENADITEVISDIKNKIKGE